jgi:hypothetical protein
MSGSGPGGLGSRFQTNSFAYRNTQAYSPFYLVEKGDSFYGLSIPQYSHATYHSLAYHGGSIGSNSRIGRHQRTNNIPPTPFVPPNVSYLDNFKNSVFHVNGKLLTNGESKYIKKGGETYTDIINYWNSTIDNTNSNNIIEAYGTNKKGYNYIFLQSYSPANPNSSISQTVTGNVLAGKPIYIKIYCSRGPSAPKDTVKLRVTLTSGSYSSTQLITIETNQISNDDPEPWTLCPITFTPSQDIKNPTINFAVDNTNTGNTRHINIHSPSISLSN